MRIIGQGAIFGEIGLIHNSQRTATIQSLNYTMCAALSSENFNHWISKFPEIIDRMKKQYINYSDDPW